jgi:F0F1-type ATP synthase assembly protein I
MAARNGFERWRGEVTAHLEDISRRLDEYAATAARIAEGLTARNTEVDKKFTSIEKAQAMLLGKVTILGVVVGAVTGALAQAVLHRLIGR